MTFNGSQGHLPTTPSFPFSPHISSSPPFMDNRSPQPQIQMSQHHVNKPINGTIASRDLRMKQMISKAVGRAKEARQKSIADLRRSVREQHQVDVDSMHGIQGMSSRGLSDYHRALKSDVALRSVALRMNHGSHGEDQSMMVDTNGFAAGAGVGLSGGPGCANIRMDNCSVLSHQDSAVDDIGNMTDEELDHLISQVLFEMEQEQEGDSSTLWNYYHDLQRDYDDHVAAELEDYHILQSRTDPDELVLCPCCCRGFLQEYSWNKVNNSWCETHKILTDDQMNPMMTYPVYPDAIGCKKCHSMIKTRFQGDCSLQRVKQALHHVLNLHSLHCARAVSFAIENETNLVASCDDCKMKVCLWS